MKELTINNQAIQDKIYTIRGVQVMLDEDLAVLYGVESKRLNEQVKRNIERFPEKFRFQLTENEYEILRSQFATLRFDKGWGTHKKYLPYVFTEQGVSMLSAVLRSQTAIEVSIKIIDSFVEMRKFISSNANMFGRFERIEQRLSLHDEKFNTLFQAIENKEIKQKQHIFYDGQIFELSHDRFLIVDEKEVYHFGASLKDLGKKWFAVSKLDINSFELLGKLK